MDPRALNELIPDWKEKGAPLNQPVTGDQFLFLTETGATATPHALLPDCFRNDGNYVISLGNVVRWLATQAEALGVEIFPGFPAAEVLYGEGGAVRGVATGNLGIGKDGEPTANFQLGMELHAKYTIFAEGSRGSLGRQLIARFKLDEGRDPQSYGIGLKELWEVKPERAEPGLDAAHRRLAARHERPTAARSSITSTTTRSRSASSSASTTTNPYLSPFEEFQRWKTHPEIRKTLEGGKRLGYGARSITAGGILSLPKTVFPGGAFVGCEAGYLNSSRIKGSHAAIKSGMLAAEAAFDALVAGRQHDELAAYPAAFEKSWLRAELDKSRNFKQWFKKGFLVAALMTGIEQWLLPRLGIHSPPWTIHRTEGRSPLPAPGRRVQADRVPQARQRDHLRSPVERLRQQHQPRRGPAGAPDAEGCEPCRCRSTSRSSPARRAATARPASTSSSTTRRHRAAADQRAELRPLQDLRHQGPDPEHRLGHARGRRRARTTWACERKTRWLRGPIRSRC